MRVCASLSRFSEASSGGFERGKLPPQRADLLVQHLDLRSARADTCFSESSALPNSLARPAASLPAPASPS